VSAAPTAPLAHRLSPDVVRSLVPLGRPGTYRLIRDEAVVYLGRSDTDLRRRLLEHAIGRRGDYFTWQMHSSAPSAWTDECSQWHDLPRLAENLVHPARPDSSNDRCPFCPDTLRLVADDRDARRTPLEFR
jgi:hypothetical protein